MKSEPILICGKTLDAILADRRDSAAELRDEPWWVPSAPSSEVVTTATADDKQAEGRSPHPFGDYVPQGIEEFGESIVQTLLERGDVIIQARPGAGKTQKD